MSREQLAKVGSNGRVTDINQLTEPEMIHLSILLSNEEYQLYLIRQVKQIALSMAYIDPIYNPLIKDVELNRLAKKHGISDEPLANMNIHELEALVRLIKKKEGNLIKSINAQSIKATVSMLKEMNIKTTSSPQKHTK